MRKFSSIIFVFLLTTLSSISSLEANATGLKWTPVTDKVATSNFTASSMTVSWAANPGASYYVVQRYGGSTVATDATKPLASFTVQRPLTSFTDTGLQPKTFYYYVIKAVDNTLATSYSLNAIGKTLANPPVAPDKPLITGTGFNFVDLSFADGYGDFNRWHLERSTDGTNFTEIAVSLSVQPTHHDTNLGEGIVYWYRLRVEDTIEGGGFSAYSDVVGAITLLHVRPLRPFGLAATLGADPQTRVNLTWRAADFNRVNDTNRPEVVEIWYWQIGESPKLYTTINEGYTNYEVVGLKPSTKYTFQVRYYNKYGYSDWSNDVIITTYGPSASPSVLKAVASKDALNSSIITLDWTTNSTDEWSFNIERSVGDSLSFKEIGINGTQNTHFINAALEEGVTYYYRVRAANKYGYSKYSNIASATSLITGVPNAPFFVTATAVAKGSVTLSWSDASNNETKFEIERSADNKTFAKVGETLRNVLTTIDNGLTDNTTYYYRVRAVNSMGNSAYSAVTSVTSLKGARVDVGLVDDSSIAYPNPTTSSVKISLSETANETATISVFNSNNRQVLQRTATSNTAGDINLDLSSLPEGAYIIRLQTPTKVISKRIEKF